MKDTRLVLLSIIFILVNILIIKNSINRYNYTQLTFTEQAKYGFEKYLEKYVKECNGIYTIKYQENDSVKYSSFRQKNIFVMNTYDESRIGFVELKNQDNGQSPWWSKTALPLSVMIGEELVDTLSFFDHPEVIEAKLKFFTSDTFVCSEIIR